MQAPTTAGSTSLPGPGWSLERALKDQAVEEPINRWLHRPIAFALIRPLEHLELPITPNRITLLSGALGLAAAASYYHALEGGVVFTLAGAALLFASVVLDCADGMLARLQGSGSRFGMLLDGIVDSVVGVSVWYGVSRTLCGQIHLWWAWPACLLALPTILVHCAIYDDAKNRYLRAAYPPVSRPKQRAAGGGLERMLEKIYETIYGSIAAGTTGGSGTHADAGVARRELARPMRLLRFIGLGSSLVVIYSATLLSAIDPRLTLDAIAAVVLLGSNALMLAALVGWKRAWRRLEAA